MGLIVRCAVPALVLVLLESLAVSRYLKIVKKRELSIRSVLLKLACSAIFLVIPAVLVFSGYRYSVPLIFAALLCSFFGDFFLHMYPKLGSVYVNYALGGISFLAAHILYIFAFGAQAEVFFECAGDFFLRTPVAKILIVYGVPLILAVTVSAILIRKYKLGKFTVPVIIYSYALMFMAVQALLAAVSLMSGAIWTVYLMAVLLALGAISFVASDIVLAVDFFTGGKDFKKKKANIILYYTGQLLISLFPVLYMVQG